MITIPFSLYLINTVVCIFYAVLYISFYNKRYEQKHKNSGIKYIYATILALIISYLNFYENRTLNLLANAILFYSLDYFFYVHESNFSYIIDTLFFSFIIVVDAISFYLIEIVFTQLNIHGISSAMGYVKQYSALLLTLTAWYLMKGRVSKAKSVIPLKSTVLFLIFPLLTIYLIIILSEFVFSVNNSDLLANGLIIIMILMVLNLSVFMYSEYIVDVAQSKIDYEIIENQQIIYEQHIHDLQHKYEQTSEMIHDFRKHLNTIKQLYNENKEMLAEDYYHEVNRKLMETRIHFHCDNSILNIIMNEKMEEAKQLGIQMKISYKLSKLDLEFIKEIDLVSIFINLLDNAIEGAKHSSNTGFINLTFKEHNEMIVVILENSYEGEIKIENNKIKSTKKGHYGLGISIAKRALRKYSGNLEMKADTNVFTDVLLIPYKNSHNNQ